MYALWSNWPILMACPASERLLLPIEVIRSLGCVHIWPGNLLQGGELFDFFRFHVFAFAFVEHGRIAMAG